MSGRRTRGMNSLDRSKTTSTRAAAIAKQLGYECSRLLDLYKQRESFTVDVADGRLVSVPPPSSQLDTTDNLWRLHSALLQCSTLLERAIAKEEEKLGGDVKGDYEIQRGMVNDRLTHLLRSTEELLKATNGTALTPDLDGLELDGTTLFELKLWVYRIYKEVEHWTRIAITILTKLSTDTPKERGRMRRSAKHTRR